MARTQTRDLGGRSAWQVDRLPFEYPAGLKILVPGLAQFSWNQRERGFVLVGSFIIALTVWLWTWGTWLSYAVLIFAFLTHATSTVDALQQGSFPVYRRRPAVLLTGGTLGLAMYLPVTCVLFVIAWPGFAPDSTGRGYLVNCWAYRHTQPHQGDWIWLRLPPSGQPYAGEVVAVSGQEVEWTGKKWQVDGHECILNYNPRLATWHQVCRFHVPKDQVLIEPDDDGATSPGIGSPVLVTSDKIIGRAWAKFYPIRDRHLL
jgi:hypothetical protein